MADRMKLFKLWWWRFGFNELRLRWQLARYGEVMILNAIDAIDAANHQLDDALAVALGLDPVVRETDIAAARDYMTIAIAHLKKVIDYSGDEPDPTEPNEDYGITGPRPRFIDEKEREDYGILHVVPKDYAINQGNK